jgi:hypothetical protein
MQLQVQTFALAADDSLPDAVVGQDGHSAPDKMLSVWMRHLFWRVGCSHGPQSQGRAKLFEE